VVGENGVEEPMIILAEVLQLSFSCQREFGERANLLIEKKMFIKTF
jgi:hypothetical protein